VAYYNFDGNTNDSSGNGLNATNVGATPTTGTKGLANTAYAFDPASSSCMSVANNALLNLQANMTFSLWFMNYSDTAGYSRLLSKESTNGYELYFYDQNRLIFTGSGGRRDTLGFTANTWHHIVVTKTGTEVVEYLDNVVSNQYSAGTFSTTSNAFKLLIGCYSSDNSTRQNYFKGKLDNFRIYNKALTNEERATIYNTEKP